MPVTIQPEPAGLPPPDREFSLGLWNRFDQFAKKKGLRYLEKGLARPARKPEETPLEEVKRLLVIRSHDQLGDFLLSTPALLALRNRFPGAHIGLVVRSYCADTVQHHPHIDEILIFQEYGLRWTPGKITRFWKALYKKWDMAVVLSSESHSLTSDLIAVLSGAKIILGSGSHIFPGCSRNFFYDLIAPDPGRLHQSERNLAIVRYIGADTGDLSERVHITTEEKNAVRQAFGSAYSGFPVIGIHIGGSKSGNRWPVDRFVRIAEMLHDLPAGILVFWGPGEKELSETFLGHVRFKPQLIPPSTLRRLAVHFSLCDLVISNDTGTMHLCAGVGTPLVAVFGPTDPEDWKPAGDLFMAIRSKDHKTQSVTAEEIFQAAVKLIGKIKTKTRGLKSS